MIYPGVRVPPLSSPRIRLILVPHQGLPLHHLQVERLHTVPRSQKLRSNSYMPTVRSYFIGSSHITVSVIQFLTWSLGKPYAGWFFSRNVDERRVFLTPHQTFPHFPAHTALERSCFVHVLRLLLVPRPLFHRIQTSLVPICDNPSVKSRLPSLRILISLPLPVPFVYL